jgi:Putative adhesin
MEFATPEPVTLVLKIPAGTVEVTADKVTTSEVELAPDNPDDEAARRLVDGATVALRGRELVVDVPQKLRLFRFPKLVVRVTVPLDSTVRASIASAEMRVTGQLGGLEVKSASGDVAIERVVGRYTVQTASGDVGIGTVEGDGKVHTASGDIGIRAVNGNCEVRSASGDLGIDALTGSLSCHTASGDVQIGAVDSGDVKANTGSGDVQIGIRRGAHAWLDLNTGSGTVGSNLDATDDEPPSGTPDVSIRANSGSGDILLTRA